jgi:hypothetical protein
MNILINIRNARKHFEKLEREAQGSRASFSALGSQ